MVLKLKNNKLYFDEQLLSNIQQKNNNEVLPLLTNEIVCQVSDSAGLTLLHFAAEYGNDEIAQYLLNFGVDVNARDKYRRTPLLIAVTRSEQNISIKTINVLLEANADIFATDVCHRYPLQRVVDNLVFSNLRVIKNFFVVLQANCHNNAALIAKQLIKAKCPIERAAYMGNHVVTEIMIKFGCEVDTPHPLIGHTALHVAITLMDLASVKMLIRNGANVTKKIGDRMLPLSTYLITVRQRPDYRNPEIMKALMGEYFGAPDKAAETELSLKHLLELGTEQDIRYTLKYNVDFDLKSNYGNTALHYLAFNPNPNVIVPLQNRIIKDLNTRNWRDCTPLHYAAATRNPSTVKALLDNGAEIDPKALHGNTPLSAVFYTITRRNFFEDREDDLREVIDILLQYDASVQIILPEEQATMFDFVFKSKKLDLAEPLVAKFAVVEKLGEPIVDLIRNKIETQSLLKTHYDLYKQQLEDMKKIVVYESITIFKLLTQSEKEIVRRYAYNDEIIKEFEKFDTKYYFKSYYYDVLRKKLNNALPKLKLIRDATGVIFELTMPKLNQNYLVTRRIIDYLGYEGMQVLNKV